MRNPPIRVLVADSQRLNAEALAAALRNEPDMDVLDDHPSLGKDAIEAVVRRRPDIALIDLWLPDMEGAAVTHMILARRPGLRIILLSWFYGVDEIDKALSAGAVGFFPRTLSLQQVKEGIRRAHSGESPVYLQELEDLFRRMSQRAQQSDFEMGRLKTLTRRELELLSLLSLHMSVNEVADQMSISRTTVKAHIRNILTKTDTTSTKEVVNLAIRCGLIRI